MSADVARQWLRHGDHGGYFHCPEASVAEFLKLGWQLADEPEEQPSAVVAENLAAQEAARQAAEQAAPQTPSTKKQRTAPSSEGSE